MEISDNLKKNFKAYTFKDDSVYYGETAYLDDENNVHVDLDKLEDSKIKTLKLIRHGYGMQLYGVQESNHLCRYEGQWIKDNRTGKGICSFSDKSTYEGSFYNGKFHGNGKFTWNTGNIYIGDWFYGKMEGEGEFKHFDGHILKGKFKNNYYVDEDRFSNTKIFLNPFDDISVLDNKREKIRQNLKNDKDNNQEKKFVYIKYIEPIHL